MKLLVIVPSAAGLLNHSLALSHMLKEEGHETIWCTGPEARDHLTFMNSPFLTVYSDSHSIDFDRTNPQRLPHIQQVCQKQYLRAALKDELDIVREFQPDLIVTKNFWTVPCLSLLTGIPWVTYYTGGAVNLLDDTSPLNRVATPDLTENVNSVAAEFGLKPFSRCVPGLLESPFLNIVRGTPRLSFLTPDELRMLPKTTAFAGNLNCDGADSQSKPISKGNRPLVYLTFGSVCYDQDLYKQTIEGLGNLNIDVLLTSMHIPLDRLGPLPNNVRFERYVPNSLALSSADLVIHHGGYGTLLEAVAQGVPQLVIPENTRSTCQAHQAAMIEQLGVGLHLSRTTLSPLAVANAVKEILSGPFREQAHELQEELNRETPILHAQLCQRMDEIVQ